jgi:hypothetical protein
MSAAPLAAPRSDVGAVRRPPGGQARAATSAILLAFLAVQTAIVLLELTGPFTDESIYLAAGRRTLEGHGLSDQYLTWFAGSLLWPAMAATASTIGGLEAARVLAAVCIAVGIGGAARAAGTLFGAAVAPWTALVLATSGAVVALGHLAVYDGPAVAATGIALAAVSECDRRDDRLWLVLAAVALAVATLAKYPVLLFAGVPLAALVLALRRGRAVLDLAVLGFVCGALLMVFFLLEREQLLRFLDFRVRQNPSFGLTRAMTAYQMAYFAAIPLTLAIAGALLAARGRRRRLTLALLTAPLMPVLYHLGSGTSVGVDKHTVFVALFAAPLAGLALHRGWQAGGGRRVLLSGLVLAAAALGAIQSVRVDRSWVDVRPSVDFLAARVVPGERLLVDNSWPYAERLYAAGRLRSPFDVYDVYRVRHGEPAGSLCDVEWFVESPGASSWPEPLRDHIQRCATFVKVYEQDGFRRLGLGRDVRYFSFEADVIVYRNERGRS